MGTRVPLEQYDLSSANSFSSLHDLNTADGRPPEVEAIGGVNRDTVTEDSLDNDDASSTVDCMHDSYRSSLPLPNDRPALEDGEASRTLYALLTIDDVSPIESARARFLQIIVDHFITDHVIEVTEMESDYSAQSDKQLSKRKSKEVQYEGDPNFALPLMYVANMYETLVSDVNIRLSSLNGVREKTIGVALEASGGLYRKLAKKFPKKGPCQYRRRELATSLETRARFPELVIQEEKRVRFVVVNGLDIVEKPNNMLSNDAEWFKRLTGRDEVAVLPQDYKFYSPRHKQRRHSSTSGSSVPTLPALNGSDNCSGMGAAQGLHAIIDSPNEQVSLSKHHQMQPLSHQSQFHPIHQSLHQTMHHSSQAPQFPHNHHCGPASSLSDIAHPHHSPIISQHIACLQPLVGSQIGGRLHIMSSLAKFCDECGAPYLRETSKFCSECGAKRLGI